MTRAAQVLWIALAFAAAPSADAAWRQEQVGSSSPFAITNLELDPNGDVIVGGSAGTGLCLHGGFAVAKLSAVDGSETWQTIINGAPCAPDFQAAKSVAVDGTGAVVAAGHLVGATTCDDFAVVKFAGATGAEVWRTLIDSGGSEPCADVAGPVALLPSGDVVAGGILGGTFSGDFVVVRLAAATGAEVWRYQTAGPGPAAVAIDPAGDVVVAGTDGAQFVVAKLEAVAGTEVWRTEIEGTGGAFGNDAIAVVVDAASDVIALGRLNGDGAAVVKFDGATGDEQWRYTVGDAAPGDLDIDGDDPAVVATVGPGGDTDIFVAKLDGATGTEVWTRRIDGPVLENEGPFTTDSGLSIAVSGDGDVVAGGGLSHRSTLIGGVSHDFWVEKLDGASGVTRWQQSLLLHGARVVDVEVAASGDVFAATSANRTARLSGLDGAVGPVAGRRLTVKDRAGVPAARSLSVHAADSSIVVPSPGSAGDPTTAGATLRIVNPTTLETATFTLPAAGWSVVGAGGYSYRDNLGTFGPCGSARATPGRLKASCAGRRGPIGFNLDEPSQGGLAVSLTLGGAAAQCAFFGGTVRRDVGTSNPGPAGLFKAVQAPFVSGTCP